MNVTCAIKLTVRTPQIATVHGAPSQVASRPKGKLPIGPKPRLIKPNIDMIRPRLVSLVCICKSMATEERNVV